MSHSILIAEDHPLLRTGLRAVIERDPDFRVVGEAADGRDAVQMAWSLRPDLVMLDLSLPLADGVDAAQQIRRRTPGQKILALSEQRSEIHASDALRAGCAGFLLKDATHEETLQAMRTVLAGRRYISQEVADQLLSGMLQPAHTSRSLSVWDTLTSRERSVFRLIAEGGTNRTAAEQLKLSPKTIEKHRANLMRKLHARSAVELMLLAVEMGLVTRPALAPMALGPGHHERFAIASAA